MTQDNNIRIRFRLQPTTRPVLPPTSGREVPPAGSLPRVVQVLALAIQFQEMIRSGEIADYADLARLGGLSRERISQIMKLVWLAPDIQIEVLNFPPVSAINFPIRERALRNISDKICWDEQRELWSKLKQTSNL